ncbi:MAG: hypothetical protein HZB30_03215 [Nitrospirae bacterium]|nr:hypothetical protein [Nitrospirota bacterium]
MIKSIQKILFFDKSLLALSFAIILTASFAIITSVYTASLEKQNNTLKSQLAELQSLTKEVTGIKSTVELKEKKIGLTKTGGLVPALEQILKSLGMKAKAIKPMEKNKVKDYTEEDAELEILNADLNSIVNLLYKIDNSPVPLKIKNSAIKTTFEDPNKFILKLTVSLLSRT